MSYDVISHERIRSQSLTLLAKPRRSKGGGRGGGFNTLHLTHNTEGYISPQWYVETKPSTAKTVPTWNYVELQLYGVPRILASPHAVVEALSDKTRALYTPKVGKSGRSGK